MPRPGSCFLFEGTACHWLTLELWNIIRCGDLMSRNTKCMSWWFNPSGAFDERPDVSSCEISHELRSATDGPSPLTRAAHRLSDAQSVPAAPGPSTGPTRDAAAGGAHISDRNLNMQTHFWTFVLTWNQNEPFNTRSWFHSKLITISKSRWCQRNNVITEAF